MPNEFAKVPEPVLKELTRIRLSRQVKMLDRPGVINSVKSNRVREWLENATPSEYWNALNEAMEYMNAHNGS